MNDIEIDNLRHPDIYWIGRIFISDEFTQWAIAMLKMISEMNWWEESETVYYEEFIARKK